MGLKNSLKFSVTLLCLALLLARVEDCKGSDWDDDWDKDSEETAAQPDSPPILPQAPAAPPVVEPPQFVPFAAAPNKTSDIVSHIAAHELSSTGGHHAKFNETCGFDEFSHQCDPAADLVCSRETNRCICDLTKKTVYVPGVQSCLKISSFATDYSCKYDSQCREGELGPYSMCDLSTGRCVCLPSSPNLEIVEQDGTCVVAMKLGDRCQEDRECDLTIGGRAICIYPPQETTGPTLTVIPVNASKECHCHPGYVPKGNPKDKTGDLRECLPTAKDETSPCQIEEQCHAGIGELSRCFGGVCQCADVLAWKSQAVLYKGRCYIKLGLGDACSEDVQCQAGIHDNAVCDKHESYLEYDKVCQCPTGKRCDNAAAGLIMSINVIVAAIFATRILF